MAVSASATRRWPPMVAVALSILLVFLVLPNPLRVPQNNPTATAEYAPVPGKETSSNDANFAQTGNATSGGIGSNGTGGGGSPGDLVLPPPQFKPRQKNCVGNPPRQTEDPLSPPCVPFFEGDNGGNTYKGVTKDEIKIVFFNDLGVHGDLNLPWKPSDEKAQHQASLYGQDTYLVRTMKADLRYFLSRYQTYGRRVHVLAQEAGSGDCAGRQADAKITKAQYDPFAIMHLYDGAHCYMEFLAKQYKILSFGLNQDVAQSVYDNNRPYIWGFFPSQEEESAWSASFICRKLWNNGTETAKFTTDALLKGQPRKFGFIRPRGQQGEVANRTDMGLLGDILTADLKKECPRSENSNWWDDIGEYDYSSATAPGAKEAPGIIQRFKTEKITTIVCYCVPIETEETVPAMQNAASAATYFPEWYWDHASRMFRAIWNQTHGDKKQSSFGVNHHWRNPAFHEQNWYLAYQQEEPATTPNVRFGFDIYHLYLNLFEGIQAAGPQLTPESIERGMFTFNYLTRSNPFVPIGGYGPYSSAVPGQEINVTQATAQYNFVDTAMGWWWDSAGTPPGSPTPGEGCVRVMDQGLRYFAREWPRGDSNLFTDNKTYRGANTTPAPCTQDDTKIADPKAGDF